MMRKCKCEICGKVFNVKSGYRLICDGCLEFKEMDLESSFSAIIKKMVDQGYSKTMIREYQTKRKRGIGGLQKLIDLHMPCRCNPMTICVKHEFQIKRLIQDLRTISSSMATKYCIDIDATEKICCGIRRLLTNQMEWRDDSSDR